MGYGIREGGIMEEVVHWRNKYTLEDECRGLNRVVILDVIENPYDKQT